MLIAFFISLIPFLYSKISPFSSLGFNSVIEEYSRNVFSDFHTEPIIKGEKIKGIFQASENNFGIFMVRFFNFYRYNTDAVIFRIKEVGQKIGIMKIRIT